MSDMNTCYGTMILFTIILIASFAMISIYYPSASNIKETMKDDIVDTEYKQSNDKRNREIYKRAVGVMLACTDTIESLLYNSNDMSAAYSMWSSHMLKRGLHEIYITATVFETCMEAIHNEEFDIAAAIKIVEEKIDDEFAIRRKQCNALKQGPIKPFCMN
jgi:hypothetical protein